MPFKEVMRSWACAARDTGTARMQIQAYPATSIFLHWITAALVMAGFALGWIMTDIPGLSPAKLRYFSWHKWIGVTVLLTWLARIIWRLMRGAPGLPVVMSRWQRRAASMTHMTIYGLLLAAPLSGLLYSQAAGVPVIYLGVLQIPPLIQADPEWRAALKLLHWLLNYTLMGLLAVHVLAALKHQFIDRDNVLARMLPFLNRSP